MSQSTMPLELPTLKKKPASCSVLLPRPQPHAEAQTGLKKTNLFELIHETNLFEINETIAESQSSVNSEIRKESKEPERPFICHCSKAYARIGSWR